MGIHGFFQCMSRWYPDVIHHLPRRENILNINCDEDFMPRAAADSKRPNDDDAHDADADAEESEVAATNKPQATSEKMRRVRRYDNFYLDMNGLIHPCCHDTAPLPEPQSEEEMFFRIFEQIDLLFDYVRPRKCLFMAVDGVAPRSKMNQQRARRFRAAQERLENDVIMNEVAAMMREDYPQLPPPKFREKWDHNVITPSTAFMERLSQAIEWYIHFKMNSDPRWKRITVVFSDSHVPGEGEHKIMHYIRGLRAQPGYDPRTSHCIHGQDADLICLGLATHEPNFAILRNEVDEKFQTVNDRFCYFDITEYREKLRHDFSNIPSMDFERVLDDFVFMCFFVGNDFLPHVPMVHIKTEGLELLFDHYVRNFSNHYYLTKAGEINFKRLQKFLLGFQEQFMHRLVEKKAKMHRSTGFAQKRLAETVQEKNDGILHTLHALETGKLTAQEASDQLLKLNATIIKASEACVAGKYPLQFEYGEKQYRDQYYKHKMGWEYQCPADVAAENKWRAAVEKIKKGSRPDQQSRRDGNNNAHHAASARAPLPDPPQQSPDSARYREVFESKVRRMAREYLRGMQWVMRYYTTGCPSWSWYYPYYYAPLLEDLIPACLAEKLNIDMVLGEPLHPVEQLLAVLPRESVGALPEELHSAVMDEKSVLGTFYPKGIDVDFTEAVQAYQGVIKLPFIDCDKLREAVNTLIDLRPDDGSALLFVHKSHPLARELKHLVQPLADADVAAASKDANAFVPIPSHIQRFAPVAGRVGIYGLAYPLGAKLECPDSGVAKAMEDSFGRPIASNEVLGFTYELKTHAEYKPQLLEGAITNELRQRQRRAAPSGSRRDSGTSAEVNGGKRKRNDSEENSRAQPAIAHAALEADDAPPPLLGALPRYDPSVVALEAPEVATPKPTRRSVTFAVPVPEAVAEISTDVGAESLPEKRKRQ